MGEQLVLVQQTQYEKVRELTCKVAPLDVSILYGSLFIQADGPNAQQMMPTNSPPPFL